MNNFGGDDALFQRFINIFDVDSLDLIQQMKTAAAADDVTALARAAHSLRGLAANLSADSVVKKASIIEDAAKSNDLSDIDTHLDRLSSAVDLSRQTLELYRKS